MNQKQGPTSTLELPGVRNESETRLQGGFLLITRVGWVVLALLVLTLNAIAIPQGRCPVAGGLPAKRVVHQRLDPS